MSTNRHTPTSTEILMIAQGNPDIAIIEPTVTPYAKPARRKPRQLEHDEQVKVFQWAEQNLDKWNGVLAYMFAIPNGGKRSIKTAVNLKAEGVRPGVPDIFLPVARTIYHGLFVEMKAKSGRISGEQVLYMARLRQQGYFVVVAYSAGEAIGWIELYLDGKLPLDK